MSVGAIMLTLFLLPHIALVFPWVFWKRSLSARPEVSTWRTTLLFLGLLSCSLNLLIYWVYMIWMAHHQTDQFWWKGRDHFETVSTCFIVFALGAAIIGKGRARFPVFLAGISGFVIWLIAHLGIL